MSGLILYQTEDGKAEVRLRAEDGSVWLTQREIAELFATTKQNVSPHAANILELLARIREIRASEKRLMCWCSGRSFYLNDNPAIHSCAC